MVCSYLLTQYYNICFDAIVQLRNNNAIDFGQYVLFRSNTPVYFALLILFL